MTLTDVIRSVKNNPGKYAASTAAGIATGYLINHFGVTDFLAEARMWNLEMLGQHPGSALYDVMYDSRKISLTGLISGAASLVTYALIETKGK